MKLLNTAQRGRTLKGNLVDLSSQHIVLTVGVLFERNSNAVGLW